jgi:hypothetical protein
MEKGQAEGQYSALQILFLTPSSLGAPLLPDANILLRMIAGPKWSAPFGDGNSTMSHNHEIVIVA